MAPTRGLSTPRALIIKNNKNKTKQLAGHEIGVLLTGLHHTLHARSCNHFLWFSHAPKLPRVLKRPKTINLIFAFSNFYFGYFGGLLLRANLGYGYTSRAGAMPLLGSPTHEVPACQIITEEVTRSLTKLREKSSQKFGEELRLRFNGALAAAEQLKQSPHPPAPVIWL